MRTATQIRKITVFEKGDCLASRQSLDDLDLVRISPFAKILNGFVPGDFNAFEFCVGLDDVFHLGLNGDEIFWGKTLGIIKIIIEAVLDRRPNRGLG
ncbi:MAG: hypothetical protein ACD_62C00621G0002 [uncultured bacterium]|nr:MAG: hypothetical protein ACD_62C00621G0002 [uncultured bacterium]